MAAVETIEMQEIVIGDDIEYVTYLNPDHWLWVLANVWYRFRIDMNDSINRDYMRRQTYYQHQALIFELERHAAFV